MVDYYRALWHHYVSAWEASDRDNSCTPSDQVHSSKETPVAITFRRREYSKEPFSPPQLLRDTCDDSLRDDSQKHQDKQSAPLFHTQHLENGMDWTLQRSCTAAPPTVGAPALLGLHLALSWWHVRWRITPTKQNPSIGAGTQPPHPALIPAPGPCDFQAHSLWGRLAREQPVRPGTVTILVKVSTQALRILSGVAGLSSLNTSVRPDSFLAA